MGKPLKEYKNEKLLINTDAVNNIISEYVNDNKHRAAVDKYKEITIAIIFDLALELGSFAASLSTMSKPTIAFSAIISILLIAYAVYCGSRWYTSSNELRSKEQIDLYKLIVEKAQENTRYTGIARIVYMNNGQQMYLTGNDYFLPHWTMNKELSIEDQNANITYSLHSEFGIKNSDIIRITPIDSEVYFSAKPIHGSIKMNAYVFYDIILKEQSRDEIIGSNHNYKWMTIDNMEKTPTALSSNKDVIDILKYLPPLVHESFENILGNYKVIWNITNKCSYNCAICATHDDDREELTLAEKMKVIHNIKSANDRILTIDFAGGDPLQDEDSVTIIQNAVDTLGKDKVSVTTTGRGIYNLSRMNMLHSIKHCEITLDASHAYLQSDETPLMETSNISREENDYSSNNVETIDIIPTLVQSLTINIPVINDDLSDEEIENLIKKIELIRERTKNIELDTSIIRLMPTGKMSGDSNKEIYKAYQPIAVVKKIKKKLEEKNIKCHLHCSLRILPAFDEKGKCHCNMLENKIGIDCAGNVYACAWGGYANNDESPTQNPYYLGNLTRTTLKKILDGESRTRQYSKIYNEINNNNFRKACSIVSYYFEGDILKESDPLSLEIGE